MLRQLIYCIIVSCMVLICMVIVLQSFSNRYTLIYKWVDGREIYLGVRDNEGKPNELLDPTDENINLTKGDKVMVSPRCENMNKKLVCPADI